MDLKPVVQEGFSIKSTVLASSIRVDLRGSADNESKSSLSQFVEHLHAEAEHLHMAEIIVDLHELYFINSVCLKVLVLWIDRLLSMPAHRRYVLTFLVDPQLHWQDRSILALQRMAPEFVRVTHWKAA